MRNPRGRAAPRDLPITRIVPELGGTIYQISDFKYQMAKHLRSSAISRRIDVSEPFLPKTAMTLFRAARLAAAIWSFQALHEANNDLWLKMAICNEMQSNAMFFGVIAMQHITYFNHISHIQHDRVVLGRDCPYFLISPVGSIFFSLARTIACPPN
jgi:hypothetical protein